MTMDTRRHPDPDSARGPMMAVSVRPARPSDVGDIRALVEAGYRGRAAGAGWTTEAHLVGGARTSDEEVAAIVAGPDSCMLVAEGDGEPVGCCQLARRRPDTAYFGMFAVRPRLQGRGIGHWLIGQAERRARRCYGITRLQMTVLQQRQDLIAWYERLGYVPTGERVAFPYGDERYGVPRRGDLAFVVLEKVLGGGPDLDGAAGG